MNEKENIEVTQRVFRSTTEKYKWGAASNLELTNASNDLINAQSTYVQAMLSLVQAQAELEEFLNN
jgi:outer membrane protein TolC